MDGSRGRERDEKQDRAARATLFLLVGLPGAGKTTMAKELEEGHRALRLTPDEWMLPLFGDGEADGARDILEGRLLWLGLRAAQLGVDVVVDFGLWGRDERSALRWLARTVGADCRIMYLPVDLATQVARVMERSARLPGQEFVMTIEEIERGRAIFEAPDEGELNCTGMPPPPGGFENWSEWAAHRWPSLPDVYGRVESGS